MRAPADRHILLLAFAAATLLSCGPSQKTPEPSPRPDPNSSGGHPLQVIVRPHDDRLELLVLATEEAKTGAAQTGAAQLRIRAQDRILMERPWDRKDVALDLQIRPGDRVQIELLVDGTLERTQSVWP